MYSSTLSSPVFLDVPSFQSFQTSVHYQPHSFYSSFDFSISLCPLSPKLIPFTSPNLSFSILQTCPLSPPSPLYPSSPVSPNLFSPHLSFFTLSKFFISPPSHLSILPSLSLYLSSPLNTLIKFKKYTYV